MYHLNSDDNGSLGHPPAMRYASYYYYSSNASVSCHRNQLDPSVCDLRQDVRDAPLEKVIRGNEQQEYGARPPLAGRPNRNIFETTHYTLYSHNIVVTTLVTGCMSTRAREAIAKQNTLFKLNRGGTH